MASSSLCRCRAALKAIHPTSALTVYIGAIKDLQLVLKDNSKTCMMEGRKEGAGCLAPDRSLSRRTIVIAFAVREPESNRLYAMTIVIVIRYLRRISTPSTS